MLTAIHSVHAVRSACRGNQSGSCRVQDGSRRHENNISTLCCCRTHGVLLQQGHNYHLSCLQPLWFTTSIVYSLLLSVFFTAMFIATQCSEKPVFFKKAHPSGFYWVLGFIVFFVFLFGRAVGKLFGWFSSSAKLLFRFAGSPDYLKMCKFITY